MLNGFDISCSKGCAAFWVEVEFVSIWELKEGGLDEVVTEV